MVGRAIKQQLQIAALPFVPRTIEDEERAGYDAGASMRKLDGATRESVRAAYEEELHTTTEPRSAARLRGLIRALSDNSTEQDVAQKVADLHAARPYSEFSEDPED